MKKVFTRSILLLCALLLSHTAYADNGYTITVPTIPTSYSECYWTGTQTTSSTSKVSTTSMAVSNGVIYGVIAGYSASSSSNGIAYYNTISSSFGLISTGATYNGSGIAADSQKNIIFAYGADPWDSSASPITSMRVYKAGSAMGDLVDTSNYKDLDFSSVLTDITSYTEYFSASGNLYDGTGYIYFTNGSKIVRITVKHNSSGTISYTQSTITIPTALASSTYPGKNFIRQQPNGLFMLMIRSNTSTAVSPTITLDCSLDWTNLRFTSYGTTSSYYQASSMAYLKGHELYAHPSGTRNTATNADGHHPVVVAIDRSQSTTVTSHYGWTTGAVGAYGTVNAWCEFEQINDNTMGLYLLSPQNTGNSHVSRYDILATETSDLTGTVVKNTVNAVNRQDASLSWNALSGASSYKVEYYTTYTIGTTDYTTTWSTIAESTTATTATLEDICWRGYSSVYYPRTYHFRVTPLTAGGNLTGSALTVSLTPDLLATPVNWRSYDPIKNYNGYQKVQLFWSPADYGCPPNYYNVYRDGVKINEKQLLVYNFIDLLVPADDHSYYIEACYNQSSEMTGDDKTYTSTKTITVAKRNPMKTTYSLEEIYNHRIGTEIVGKDLYPNLTTKTRYKQGYYYDGAWYIAQMSDQTSDAKGGVIRLQAHTSAEILAATGTRPIEFTANRNAGIAMDDAGNIFVRRGGNTGYDARTNFAYELGWGHIYKYTGNGEFAHLTGALVSSHVDLTGIGLEEDCEQWAYAGDIWDGRVDYYAMSGNIADGTAYLYVSSHRSKKAIKVKLTNSGSAVTADIDDSTIITLKKSETGEDFDYGDENFVFPVKCNGRNDYVYNCRSRGYFNIIPGTSSSTQKSIYETRSRVNNAGGCTIEFNGEIFLITPQCTYSQNSGNFIVAMGSREDSNGETTLTAATADLSNLIPVAQWTQDDITDGSYSDANGVWLTAVPGLIAGEVDLTSAEADQADCVYIYEYVPGVRFAKYRLVPNNYFPPTPVDLEINSVYDETEYRENDLVRYDGVAKFGTAIDNETISSASGNANYKIDSYTYTFRDAAGTDVWTYTVYPDGKYTYTRVKDGETTTGSGEGALVSEEYTDIEGSTHDAYFVLEHSDLKRGTVYESTVTVNYVNTTDATDTHQSETTIDQATKDYTPIAPEPESVTLYEGKEGTSVEGMYRIEVNFDEPTDESGNTPEEPVSYYVVTVTKPVVDANGNPVKDENGNPVTVTETVTGFELMVNGSANDNSGNYYDHIPGDYDFDNNEGYWASESSNKSTIVFYYTTPVSSTTSTDPSDWIYNIEAVYGGTNPNISAEASDSDSAENVVVTLIESISGDVVSYSVYPVPAHATVTVTAPEAIESLKVYSIAGEAVMTADGNGECSATLDINHLAAGYYLLEINGGTIVRIIKK